LGILLNVLVPSNIFENHGFQLTQLVKSLIVV